MILCRQEKAEKVEKEENSATERARRPLNQDQQELVSR